MLSHEYPVLTIFHYSHEEFCSELYQIQNKFIVFIANQCLLMQQSMVRLYQVEAKAWQSAMPFVFWGQPCR